MLLGYLMLIGKIRVILIVNFQIENPAGNKDSVVEYLCLIISAVLSSIFHRSFLFGIPI